MAEVNIDPRYGPIYSEIIAESENFMAHSAGYGFKDSPVGNLVTDAMRSATGTQIALDVDGWIAQPIFASPLSGADIFQAVPYGYDAESGYGYKIVTFSLTGYLLKSALEYAIHESLSDGSFNVQVSNMEIKYDSRKPLGQKISLMKIGGQPYALFSGYSITMSDGLARFLYLAGLSMVNPQPTGLVEYEVVKDYVVAHSPLNYVAEGRIQDTFETSVATNQIDQVPVQFTLLQNYPNPFNPETTILFQLGQADRVSVRIFNTVGQLVKTLVDGHKSRGTYTIKWNSKDETGTDVASGVYFYQLKTKDAVEQKKMLLIR